MISCKLTHLYLHKVSSQKNVTKYFKICSSVVFRGIENHSTLYPQAATLCEMKQDTFDYI